MSNLMLEMGSDKKEGTPKPILSRWVAPLMGKVKVNVDGGVLKEVGSGDWCYDSK